MRSCAIHVHKHSVEAMQLQQCREVTTVILSITPWLPTYMGQSLIRCNRSLRRHPKEDLQRRDPICDIRNAEFVSEVLEY